MDNGHPYQKRNHSDTTYNAPGDNYSSFDLVHIGEYLSCSYE